MVSSPQGELALYYAGHVAQARACVENLNHRVVCVAAAMNAETQRPSEEMLAHLGWTVALIRAGLERPDLPIVPHQGYDGQRTACPGRYLLEAIPEIEARAARSDITVADVLWLEV